MGVQGGKDKYLCLYSFIKRENPKLYEAINDLCIDGIFRTQRYKNTFLLPNDKLTATIVQHVEKDDDEKAVTMIRALLLKDCLATRKDFGAEVVNMNSKQLDDPEGVYKQLTEMKKKIVNTNGDVVSVIYKYDGADVPKATKENLKKSAIVSKKGGSSDNHSSQQEAEKHHELVKELTNKLITKDQPEHIFQNFSTAVKKLLTVLSEKNKLAEARHLVSSHPVLTWYFLTLGGSHKSIVTIEDLEQYKKQLTADAKIYDKVFNKVEEPKGYFTAVNKHRNRLLHEESAKSTLPRAILAAYEDSFKSGLFPSELVKAVSNDPCLKALEDELRFVHEDKTSAEDVLEVVSDLNVIDWSNPKKKAMFIDPELWTSMVKPTEAYTCGPLTFVKSIYFLHITLSDDIEHKILNTKGGGSVGGYGNPEKQSCVVYKGGECRSMLRNEWVDSDEDVVENILQSLTEEQKEELKRKLA